MQELCERVSVISKACMAPGTCPDPELCCPEPETPSSSGHMTKVERDELCVALTAPQLLYSCSWKPCPLKRFKFKLCRLITRYCDPWGSLKYYRYYLNNYATQQWAGNLYVFPSVWHVATFMANLVWSHKYVAYSTFSYIAGKMVETLREKQSELLSPSSLFWRMRNGRLAW